MSVPRAPNAPSRAATDGKTHRAARPPAACPRGEPGEEGMRQRINEKRESCLPRRQAGPAAATFPPPARRVRPVAAAAPL